MDPLATPSDEAPAAVPTGSATSRLISIGQVSVGPRFRRQLGDLDGLAASIKSVGLLHPIVVTPDGRLIAGQRRLEACKKLGWTEVPVRVVDLANLVKGEHDENFYRKNFLPSEAVAIAKALEPLERAKAKERQKEHANTAPGRPADTAANLAEVSKGDTRDRIARSTGIGRSTLTKARAIVEAAEANPRKYQPLVEEMDRTGRVDKAYRKLKELVDRDKAISIIKASSNDNDQEFGIHHGDFRELAHTLKSDSVDLVFTDPPYDIANFHVYGDIAILAARILKSGGSFICYAANAHLPEILDLIRPHLRYWWQLVVHHMGGPTPIHHKRVRARYKPLLWFIKGKPRRMPYVQDMIETRLVKTYHPFGQGHTEAEFYIEHLTKPGELVVDFFCGGGTTAVAARQLGREVWTCDVKMKYVKIARARVADALNLTHLNIGETKS